MKGLNIFILTNFIWALSSPKEVAELWGYTDIGEDPKDNTLTMHFIHWGIMSFLAELLVLFGVPYLKVVGFTWLVPLKFFSELFFVTNKIEKLPLSKDKYFFWVVVSAVGVATLLL